MLDVTRSMITLGVDWTSRVRPGSPPTAYLANPDMVGCGCSNSAGPEIEWFTAGVAEDLEISSFASVEAFEGRCRPPAS